ncbi:MULTISPECIES: GNAT family N-acetyltransferase [Rhodomicrobium]|uniref:GNAT family N-acetyltransferase n=1 Tax=Rhodomicrobium TaxID=1068 RepID=UPI000B4B83E6|nr:MULTISPECIES: GNAT family N-acetyltransferase [Rhodomicrobium]
MGPVVPLSALDKPEEALAGIEAIFFASALTQDFASDEARANFRELWLGRYLRHFPAACFVALDPAGAVAGYLTGAPASNEPPLLGPDYYDALPAALIAAFPAHVHVNVRGHWRGRGVGAALVEAFRAHCRARGISGLHAVTGADTRAAAFFSRCGLTEQAQTTWRGRRLVFLGEELSG